MTVTLNGENYSLPTDATLIDALSLIGVGPTDAGIAVAVDDRVVRRADWGSTVLDDGARVEIVTAAQGG